MEETTKKTNKFTSFFKKIGFFLSEIFIKYRFFFSRLGISLVTLALAIIFGFLVVKLMPGDVVQMYAKQLADARKIPYEEAYRQAVQLLNYDPSLNLWQQLGQYLSGIFKGNFGVSMFNSDVTTLTIIRDFLPWTLFLSGASLLISFVLGIALGSKMASKRKGFGHAAANTYIVVSGSIPDYLFGLILILIFAVGLRWFPISGNYDILLEMDGWPWILNVLYHAFLPIVAYSFVQIGVWAISMRGSAIGTLGEDYIYAARVRGLRERTIRAKYLRRNSMLPLITSLAVSFGAIFGGSPLMENIFNYPGFGAEFNNRIGLRDYFIIQGLIVFMSLMIILANFVADSLYSIIDPRIRRGN
ncbi:MAG: ABC transporter permease [Bacilli bacterium]|nr:ABC transporter permease [Bacilli bacterium]